MLANINRGEKYDIYIGRGASSQWGNPYSVQEYGRDVAISLFKTYLWDRIQKGSITIEELAELHGKTLGCYCFPKSCHGNVLEKASKWAYDKLNEKPL